MLCYATGQELNARESMHADNRSFGTKEAGSACCCGADIHTRCMHVWMVVVNVQRTTNVVAVNRGDH